MAADPLIELRGLHMPPMDLAATVAETCAALAVGLLVAWLLVQAVRLASRRRVPPERIALSRLAAVDGGLAERAVILRDYAAGLEGEGDWLSKLDVRLGGLFSNGAGAGMREALYRPGAAFDLGGFDAAVMAALKRVER